MAFGKLRISRVHYSFIRKENLFGSLGLMGAKLLEQVGLGVVINQSAGLV